MDKKFKIKFLALESDKSKLLSFIDNLDEEKLNSKTNNDKWSLAQIMFHVIKGEQYALISVMNSFKQGVKLEPVGLSASVKSFILNSSLKTNFKFKAPPIAQNVPESVNMKELLKKWDEIRNGINDVCIKTPKEKYNQGVFNHLFIGVINLKQTLNFLLFHQKHHLKQIENISLVFKQ